jgi:hypothetical protein
MAARRPAAIGDLTDELLAHVFAAVSGPNIYEEEPMRGRCTLPQVCRRWKAAAASPAAAPVWARVEVAHMDDPAADPDRSQAWSAGPPSTARTPARSCS